MNKVMILKLVIISAAVLYYIATISFIFKRRKLGNVFAALGVVPNLAVVVYNFIVNGYVPFVSMYQVLTFLSLCFMVVYLYMIFIYKHNWVAPFFTACSALVMTGVSFMKINLLWHFPPALQSFWFIPHVLSYMISYSLCAVAFLIVIINLLGKSKIKDQTIYERESGIYHIIKTAFPFMTTGLLFGAIWANEIWGYFWSWDPKENWSFITWIFYSLYLHCRRKKELKKFSNVLIILGFIALLITFFGVNLMKSSNLHSYT